MSLEPHPAGDGVDGVVAADVLHEGQQVALPEQGAAVHRAGRLVRALLDAHGVEQAVELALGQARRRLADVGQADRVDRAHQVAEDRALPAAGRDDALGGPLVESLDAGTRLHGGRADVPVDGDRIDVGRALDQSLVSQVAEDEQLGRRAERHQRHQLALVDEDRQRALGGDGDRARRAELVANADLARQRRPRLAEADRRRVYLRGPVISADVALLLGGLVAISVGECASEASSGLAATGACAT